MNQPTQDGTPEACDHRLIHQFLESENYRMEDAELITHLDSCSTCREYLETEAGGAEVWNNATELLKPDEFDQAGTPPYSAATLHGESLKQPVAARDVLDSLTPSEDPHHLGRLGTYEVTGVVGVGGMGVVLKAIDPSLDRVVAVKVMAPRLANHEKARKRFAREAKAAAAVLHPNVIPIHSVSSDSSVPYLVMAYVRGGSLQKRIEQEGPLPVVEILRIGSQIAAGLAAAHDQGLVHRDIKPENVLLEEGVERVTITDFGLARAVDDNTVTQQGTIAGTPQYMSPEQARGEQVDQQSDLFSLGSVLYALCAGRPPFRGDSSYGVMRRIIDEEPTPLRELNPDTPKWLSDIIEKLMSKEKSERFETAAEVHELLERCLSHAQRPDAIALPHIPGGSRQRRPPFLKTGKGVLTVISLAAVLVMALPVIALLWPDGTPNPQIGTEEITGEITEDAEFPVLQVNEDLAERLIGRKEHLTFTKLETLSPEVAAILARHPANLSFPALKQISPEVAKALAQKQQLWLRLNGLQEISPEVARELASAKCALSLVSVRAVTPELAEILIKPNGTLSLGLSSITPDVAETLSQHTGWLSLNNLRTIDSESAAALAAHKHWITLDGLTSLTQDVAAALGNFNGDKLDLNGLKSLDLETAKKLAQARCRSGLYLNGLTTVTPEILDALANGNSGLSFQGLEEIDIETKQALEAASEKLRKDRQFLAVRDLRFVKVLATNGQPATEEKLNAGQLIKRLNTKHGGLTPKLQKMFSKAAGIPNAEWHKFAADPKGSADAIKGEPLSLVLWKLNPLQASTKNLMVLQDFQYIGGIPKPKQLSDAMFPSQVNGYYSMIQPHYISGLGFDLKQGTKQLKGNFRFQAPNLYAGKIDYVVQIEGDDLRVVEFTLPNYGITIIRDDDGLWQRSQPDVDDNVEDTTSAAAQIRSMGNALDLYKLDGGIYPSTKEGLKALVQKPADEKRAKNWGGPYLKELPADPWGNRFGYEFPGTRSPDGDKPNIWSWGPDGKDNTDDDVNSWELAAIQAKNNDSAPAGTPLYCHSFASAAE